MKTLNMCVAEVLGTFYLCFAGIAAILNSTDAVGGGGGLVAIALAHGLALAIAVSVFGGVSGAHFNPAVTAGLLATRRITLRLAALYVPSQLVGATLAAAACKMIFPAAAVAEANLGIPLPAPWVSGGVLFTLEFILTFLLITSVFGTAVDERGRVVKIGGFAIGLTVAFDILAGGPVTGASMNPARSFGPALMQGHWDWHLFYWLAPIAGGVVAALVYENLILKE